MKKSFILILEILIINCFINIGYAENNKYEQLLQFNKLFNHLHSSKYSSLEEYKSNLEKLNQIISHNCNIVVLNEEGKKTVGKDEYLSKLSQLNFNFPVELETIMGPAIKEIGGNAYIIDKKRMSSENSSHLFYINRMRLKEKNNSWVIDRIVQIYE